MIQWRVLVGDVRDQLATLPDASVQCCVTSPPYWGLRDYGHAGQIGSERRPSEYIAALVESFESVRRVLKPDGTLWLNLGDCYAHDGKRGGETGGKQSYLGDSDMKRVGREKRVTGLKPKDLVGIPWRVAFALQADGWYLRSDVIWSKPNPMPESVTDRPTKAHEYIFLLTKAERYYYDADAIQDAAITGFDLGLTGFDLGLLRGRGNDDPQRVSWHTDSIRKRQLAGVDSRRAGDGFRNCRSVWTVTTQPYPDAHFATFPEAIPERCIKAGSRLGDTVLDPFCGSGTTGSVAVRLGRHFVGVELNPEYVTLARQRIGSAGPLFAEEGIGA